MSNPTDIQKAIDLAASRHGGVAGLAKWLGVASSLPSMWKARGRVPPIYCPALEFAADAQVLCEAMCPDVKWFRVPDADWPGVTNGRPLIDTELQALQPILPSETRHAA